MRREILFALLLAACKGEPDSTPFCSDVTPVATVTPAPAGLTYHQDIRPLLEEYCVHCHVDGGLGPFALDTYEAVLPHVWEIDESVEGRHMPPWLATRCCGEYHDDWSLTDDQIARISSWIHNGAAEGDVATAAPLPPPRVGLSRVNVTLTMPEPYIPAPTDGRTDDTRCFVVDWPVAAPMYVTGLNPVPGNRMVVHHMTIAAVDGSEAGRLADLDAADPGPGFSCMGGTSDIDWQHIHVIGGGLLGGDFPGGLGNRVEPGSKIVFNIHYSTARSEATPDQTSVELKLEPTAREVRSLPIANVAWIAGGMNIAAGDPDAVYWYQYEPSLFTRGKAVDLWGVTPHMHNFGSRFVTRIVRADGTRECLLEIPEWHFGWEQPFWLAGPRRLEPGDELYLECHFDNSAENQPDGRAPRDIGWGPNDQDMCAGFVAWVEASQP